MYVSERPNRNAAIYMAVENDRNTSPILRRGCAAIAKDFGMTEPYVRRIHARITSVIDSGESTTEGIKYLADAYYANEDAREIKEETN